MSQEKGASAAHSEISSEKQRQSKANETVADRARQMADRFQHLPKELVASFSLPNPIDRVNKLKHIALETSIDMLPVISWLERNRAESAQLVKDRMQLALQEIVKCACLEIPEYAGGTINRQTGERPLSEGARRTAEMVTFLMVFSATLVDWANDIEKEELAKTQVLAEVEENYIRLMGDAWDIKFGSERGQYQSKCIAWLRNILSQPNRTLTAPQVMGDPEGELTGDARLTGQSEGNYEAIQSLKRRLDDIDETIQETGGTESLADEKVRLLRQLDNSTRQIQSGLRRRHHNIASQIRTFIRKLENAMPQLAAHLRTSLKLDLPHFLYSPNLQIDWKF
jgi:hypothetical protein